MTITASPTPPRSASCTTRWPATASRGR
jgi:hypothetical protein